MSTNKTNLAKVIPFPSGGGEQPSQRPWLDKLPQPRWLLNGLHDDRWDLVVREGSVKLSCRWDIVLPNGTRLTDPENDCFLKVVQLVAYFLRSDEYSPIDSPKAHQTRVQRLINLVQWMVLNKVRGFDQLTRNHLEDFIEDSQYGVLGGLLQMERRLERYIETVRNLQDYEPPLKSDGSLDVPRFFEDGGFEFQSSKNDEWTMWRITDFELELDIKTPQRRIDKWFEKLPDGGFYLVEPPVRKILNWDTIEDILWPWQYLWEHRKHCGEDAITFMPFRSIKALKKIAKKLGGKGQKTGTIPEHQAAWIIDRALRWVLEYSEDLFELKSIYDNFRPTDDRPADLVALRKLFKKYKPKNDGKGSPWPVDPTMYNRRNDLEGMSVFKALYGLLPVACAIVICAFTARRHGEVLTIRHGCISHDETGPWIETWIEKTVQDWDKTPCPKTVVKAVEVLEKLSQEAREETGEPFLFRFRISEGEGLHFNLAKYLRDFASFVEVPPLEDGSHWDFKPHQFRRFFAMLYTWRYDDPTKSFEALRHQLRHASIDRTKHYTTEPTAGEAFQKASKDKTFKVLADHVTGRSHAVGEFAERLTETMERVKSLVRKNLKIVTERNIRRQVERYMEKHNTQVVPFLWGYCVVEANQPLETVCCLKSIDGQSVVRMSNIEPSHCVLSGCKRFMANEEHRPYWLKKARAFEACSKSEENPPLMRGWMNDRTAKFRAAIEQLWPGGGENGKEG